VRVKAIAVNPLDCNARSSTYDKQSPPQILGWNAAEIVGQVGTNILLSKNLAASGQGIDPPIFFDPIFSDNTPPGINLD
jgi:hypothetical protein